MEGVVLTAKSLKNYLRRKNRPSAVPPIQNGKFLKKNYFFIFYWARASFGHFFFSSLEGLLGIVTEDIRDISLILV